jgi:hypothetical protein
MAIVLIFLGLLWLAVKFEAPVQIIAKLILWVMLWQSMGLAAKATYNYFAPKGSHYVLPLHPVWLEGGAVTTVQGTPGVTRSQSGNVSGLKMDITGTIENRTDRIIESVVVACQVNVSNDDDGDAFQVTVPVNVAPKTSTRFQTTWKARNGVSPGNLAIATHHCYVKQVEEVNQWK